VAGGGRSPDRVRPANFKAGPGVLLQGRPNRADELLVMTAQAAMSLKPVPAAQRAYGRASSGLGFVHVHAKFVHEHEEPFGPAERTTGPPRSGGDHCPVGGAEGSHQQNHHTRVPADSGAPALGMAGPELPLAFPNCATGDGSEHWKTRYDIDPSTRGLRVSGHTRKDGIPRVLRCAPPAGSGS
jgi:hypothetical protein